MTTVFSWAVGTLERETTDGFVFTAHYTILAQNKVYTSSAYGSIGFERPEGELIPFADLTEGTVVQWILDALGEDKVTSICEALQTQIDEQRTPTKAAGLPWVTV